MQLRDAYPADTVKGACFITGEYTEMPILDLDVNLDTLPAWGRLCVSPIAVRLMATTFGWEIPDEKVVDKVNAQRDTIRELRAEIRQLREALRSVVNAAELVGIAALLERELVES